MEPRPEAELAGNKAALPPKDTGPVMGATVIEGEVSPVQTLLGENETDPPIRHETKPVDVPRLDKLPEVTTCRLGPSSKMLILIMALAGTALSSNAEGSDK